MYCECINEILSLSNNRDANKPHKFLIQWLWNLDSKTLPLC